MTKTLMDTERTISFPPKGLVTNYRQGGGYKMGWGVKFYPQEQVLAMLKGGGHKRFWGSFYALA